QVGFIPGMLEARQEWVTVYEDFTAFLVEYQLVWARKKDPSQTQGSKINKFSGIISLFLQAFKPLVGKGSTASVEFVDKQVDFVTEDSDFKHYQVRNPVNFLDFHMPHYCGPYSLKGYRVGVYRQQNSATQRFTGIITHHDLFTHTMIVMNDQVLEPQNVDPSMVQMTFLDDVHSLLKEEDIGITSRRRSCSTQSSTTVHVHYTRAQASSPRPAMNSQAAAPKQNPHQQQQRNIHPNQRKGSDSSVPDEEKMKEEKCDFLGRGENLKSKNKHFLNKRRKIEEDEKKLNIKRLRTDNVSDYSECSDSENSNKRMTESSSEQNAENEMKNKSTSKINGDEGKSQRSEGAEEQAAKSQSPWAQIQEDRKHEDVESLKSPTLEPHGKPLLGATEEVLFYDPNANDLHIQDCKAEKSHTLELLPKEQFVSGPPTPKCVIDITNETNAEKVVQENSTRTFGFQTFQKIEPHSSDSKLLFSNAKYLETRKQDTEQSWVSSIVNKVDLASSGGLNPLSMNEHLNAEKEKNPFAPYLASLNVASLTEDSKLHKPSPPTEGLKSKFSASTDAPKPKANSLLDAVQPKLTHSPDSGKSKTSYSNSSHTTGERRLTNKTEHDLPRSSFHPVPTRVSALETTKSPLIIDKNEHFTVYRDPALIGQETGTNHISPFLNQHTYPIHSSSHRTCLNPNSHHPTLTATPHLLAGSSTQTPLPPISSHPLNSAPHPSVHHPHLLPTVLPGVPPASLLGGHPRLEAAHASSLSHLALAHQQQQQMLQHPSPHLLGQAHPPASYNQLGLYPIIWQYPNGTHAYSGLGLPSSKWVHPENPVNAEASIRRNTPSPWLHQPTPVTSADGLGLLSHIPVRPSSADPHRPLKMTAHSSPPLSKALVDHHKEELERKAFIEPLRTVASTPAKNDLDRIPAGKDSHLHRHFVDPMMSQLQRPPQESGERLSKYKEEHRRVLQESLDVAPFTTKMKPLEGERENYSRMTPLSSSSPKSHPIKQDKEVDRSVSELYKMKHSVPQSLPQSNYFTTISNSVVNEPPRSFPSKEVSSLYTDKQSNSPSTGASPQTLTSFISSLSKPPPLIKHQPEGESIGSKVAEQLPQQMPSHSITAFRNDCRSPTHLTVSSSNTIRSMPALHRAPVFHPPIHPSLDRKESTYSSLSPPTLTPVLPVNAGGKVQELQKPPTLVPEPKDAQTTYKNASEHSLSEMWRSNNALGNEKANWPVERNSGKSPAAATASVIVRPPSSVKFESVPAMQPAPRDQGTERSSTSSTDGWKPAEAREPGRVILPNSNSAAPHSQGEKNLEAVSQGSVPSSIIMPTATSLMCSTKTDVTPAAATTTSASSWVGSEVTYSLSSTVLTATTLQCVSPKNIGQPSTHAQECKVSTTAPSATASSKTSRATQPSSVFSSTADFIHLKKHKAALAAAQFKSGNTSEAEPNPGKSQACPAPIPLESTAVTCSTPNKTHTSGSGQNSQTSQPNYHTKLKKAWLTRHSEEDKNTNKMENSGSTVSEIIKPCSVNLIASTSSEIHNSVEGKGLGDKPAKDDRASRRKAKRAYESGSESGGDSDGSESKAEQRTKRQPKPTYKKKQNDLQKRKGELEEEAKPNGVLSRSSREKSKLKLPSSSNSAGIPRSVLKDWRKVKKLKQTGESFLQDDSCCEIGPNLQKCRECRLIRNKKGEEPTHSPVFCRFYYFRRLSFSKNGVVRIDGFSSPDQYDDEALSLWTHENYDDDELDLETSKYILNIIGDKFCQLVTSEKTALSWVKKDAKIAWKRAVRGVREMCDACEATLFNIHWVCQKCGFVVCLDCYKAKERKSSRDKELYAWMKCVKGQPHDHKHLMPTQIIPGSVLTDLLDAMHNLREKFDIESHCHCTNKQSIQVGKIPAMNGVSQVLQNVLNHSNKISLCMPESQQQNSPQKSETNGNTSPGSDVSTDSKLTPPESQSPLHWLADLAEQKSREEKKENKDCPLGKHMKEERDCDGTDSPNGKTSPAVSQNNEQGSTLRDLLTTTAGKLRLGSTDAGIAFAPVYSTGAPSGKSGRTVPNILDDIIASVVENKIPPNKASKTEEDEEGGGGEDGQQTALDEGDHLSENVPHSWMCEKHVLWLQDHKNNDNWKLFKQCWKQGQPVVVSGVHKKMNISLWKAESISLDFGDHQADLLNCKDSIISNANVKEFWDGFEDISKRQKIKSGETVVLKLKDCPSGEDFKTMMPARYEDLFKSLPLPEYCNPEGKFNLASHLPGFFVRPDLGPRLCSAYGVAAAKDHDIGTTNLHIEVSDVVNILVYVGIAKGNGVLSKSGILKKFEEEDLDDLLRRRLKDSTETPGALWHIYAGKDADKIREFLQKIAKEQGLEVLPEHDPIRDQSWYVNKKLRQRLLEEYGVKTCTVVQFLGDAIILPAGALHQVQNFHSCIQVTEDFVSPEHLVQSFHLTQELRLLKEEINYDDKLQVKNILYHAVKEMVRALKIREDEMEDLEEN
uniref:Probable JmjC domain-containing histone demethylation protein 2C n=1 Tax=Monodelphis domestica TaxID=13616 RepID=F6XFN4_MONDO